MQQLKGKALLDNQQFHEIQQLGTLKSTKTQTRIQSTDRLFPKPPNALESSTGNTVIWFWFIHLVVLYWVWNHINHEVKVHHISSQTMMVKFFICILLNHHVLHWTKTTCLSALTRMGKKKPRTKHLFIDFYLLISLFVCLFVHLFVCFLVLVVFSLYNLYSTRFLSGRLPEYREYFSMVLNHPDNKTCNLFLIDTCKLHA